MPRRASARDIFAQCQSLLLGFLDLALDHVADRNDAEELVLFHHRHVPDTEARHPLHQIADQGVARAGEHRRGHALADRPLQRPGGIAPEQPDDVALADDAGDSAIAIHDHHGTDIVLVEGAYRVTYPSTGGHG